MTDYKTEATLYFCMHDQMISQLIKSYIPSRAALGELLGLSRAQMVDYVRENGIGRYMQMVEDSAEGWYVIKTEQGYESYMLNRGMKTNLQQLESEEAVIDLYLGHDAFEAKPADITALEEQVYALINADTDAQDFIRNRLGKPTRDVGR